MSWDVLITNLPQHLSRDHQQEFNNHTPMASDDQVRDKISALFPETDWGDPNYAHLDNGNYIGHIMLGFTNYFVLCVYGGNDPLKFICSICNTYNWVALDSVTNEFIDTKNPNSQGWEKFLAFRGLIVDQYGGSQVEGFTTTKKWWQFWK